MFARCRTRLAPWRALACAVSRWKNCAGAATMFFTALLHLILLPFTRYYSAGAGKQSITCRRRWSRKSSWILGSKYRRFDSVAFFTSSFQQLGFTDSNCTLKRFASGKRMLNRCRSRFSITAWAPLTRTSRSHSMAPISADSCRRTKPGLVRAPLTPTACQIKNADDVNEPQPDKVDLDQDRLRRCRSMTF